MSRRVRQTVPHSGPCRPARVQGSHGRARRVDPSRKRTSFERFSKAHNQQRADPNSAPVGSNRSASSRGDTHLGGVRSGGGSVFGTSGRSAGMQKKARARRAILGGDSDATAGACAARAGADPMTLRHQRDQAGSMLSPVSSIGVKLDSLCHWNGTPGAPVGHPRAMDAANPGAMFIERARVNPDSSSGPPTAEQTTEARPAGYYPPTTVAPASRRGHVERDLAPIRSNNGLSFADMLARNGGTRPDADARHHPPSPTRVVQFFNFQRSPACAKRARGNRHDFPPP